MLDKSAIKSLNTLPMFNDSSTFLILKNDRVAKTSIFSDKLSEKRVKLSQMFSTKIIRINIHIGEAPNERYANINSLFFKSNVFAYAM